MKSVERKHWRILILALLGSALASGCHHGSSSSAAATPLYQITVNVSGLAGSGLVLVNNDVDDLDVSSSGISTFSTELPEFATYSISVLTEPSSPTQVCSIPNGTGLVEGVTVVVSVSCGTVGTALGRFAYAVNSVAGSISGYSIDSTTGALTELAGSPLVVKGSSALHQELIDPSGSFLYVVDSGANGVYAYQLNQNNGAGQLVSGSPFATGATPASLAFDYAGAYLYVANYAGNSISAYTLSNSTGALTPIAGSPFPVTGVNPGPKQIVSSGSYLFVLNSNTSTVDVLSINSGTGALTETGNGSPYATDTAPFSFAIDPTGKVLYTANAGSSGAGSISAFTLDLSSGALTPVAGNPLAIPAVNYISIDSKSRYLFVPESVGVAVYPIVNTATGALGASPVSGPVVTGTNPYSVVTNVDDGLAFVANEGSGDIAEYYFSEGILYPIAGTPVASAPGTEFVQIQ